MPELTDGLSWNFNHQKIIHNSNTPFFYSNSWPVLNVHICNLELIVTSSPEFCLEFRGVRNSLIENIIVRYEGDPDICKALILLESGDKTKFGGPGGCHYNCFRNIELWCNGTKKGMIARRDGTQRLNWNSYIHIMIYHFAFVGFDHKAGKQNSFFHIGTEGQKYAPAQYGMRFRNGKENSVYHHVSEAVLEPIYTQNEIDFKY